MFTFLPTPAMIILSNSWKDGFSVTLNFHSQINSRNSFKDSTRINYLKIIIFGLFSGKIDVSVLTTGVSSAARKKRLEIFQALKTLIQGKKSTFLKIPDLLAEFRREHQQLLVTKEMFDDAIRDLQDENLVDKVNNTSLRLRQFTWVNFFFSFFF